GARARLHDRLERLALEAGGALHGGHQVGHEIGAPLVLVLDLRPGLLHILVAIDHLVVAAARDGQDERQKRPRCAHVTSCAGARGTDTESLLRAPARRADLTGGAPLGDAGSMQVDFARYATHYRHARMQRHADGLLELVLHSDGGPLVWGAGPHTELGHCFAD